MSKIIVALLVALLLAVYPAAADVIPPGVLPVNPAPGTASSILNNALGRVLSVTDFGAKCNVATGTGSIASGSAILPGSSYTSADVGKYVYFPGAAANGGPLFTTIQSVSGGVATLAAASGAASSASVSNADYLSIATGQSGSGNYAPGDTITLSGGTKTASAVLTASTTQINTGSIAVAAGGSGGTNGTVVFVGTTGTGPKFFGVGTVSGGALTAISVVVDAGDYTVNPTDVTAEPIVAYTPNGSTTIATVNYLAKTEANVAGSDSALVVNPLAGATISFKMQPRQVMVTTPGAYTVTPSNPVSQASTSGSGTGATFNMSWKTGGTFYYGTDDSAAFTSAIAAVGSVTNTQVGQLLVPSATCGLASTVTINSNFVRLRGTGGGLTHNIAPTTASSSALFWFGAASQKMVDIEPASAGSPRITGTTVSGISLYCNRRAAIGLAVYGAGATEPYTSNYAEECTTAGMELGAKLVGEVGTGRITIDGFASLNFATLGVGLKLSAVTNPNGNVNFAAIRRLVLWHNNASALLVQGADNVGFEDIYINQRASGNAYSVDVTTSAANDFPSNSLIFYHIGAPGGMIFRGIEAQAVSTYNNLIVGLDAANSNPLPVWGIGTGLHLQREDGHFWGLMGINGAFGGNINETNLAWQKKGGNDALTLYSGNDSHIRFIDAASQWRIFTDNSTQDMTLCSRSVGTGNCVISAAARVQSDVRVSKTATGPYAILGTDLGKEFDNLGAGGEVDFTLPAGTTGNKLGFCVAVAQVLKVIAPTSVTINVGGTVSSSAGNITSSQIGACVQLEFYTTNKWIAKWVTGTGGSTGAGGWTVN